MKKRQHINWLEQSISPDLLESKLFRFRISIDAGAETIDIDLTNDCDIDYNRLEEHLEDTPQQFIYWNTIYSTLRAYGAILERKIKARRGVLTEEAMKLIRVDKTVVKLTNEQVKMVIEKDEVLNQLEELHIKVQQNTGKVYGVCQAIQMKAENVRSLFGLYKIERQNT